MRAQSSLHASSRPRGAAAPVVPARKRVATLLPPRWTIVVSSSESGRTDQDEAGATHLAGESDKILSSHSAKQQRAFRRQARALLSKAAPAPAQMPSAPVRGASVSTSAFKPGRGGSVAPTSTSTSTSTSATPSASSGLSATSNSATSGAGSSSVGGSSVMAQVEAALPGPSAAPTRMHMNHYRALVLDTAYRPINVVNWSRAVMLDVSAKAEVLDYYDNAFAVSGRGEHPLPAVMRIQTNVNLNEVIVRVACTRRNVMVRDRFTCCYCGARRDLTLDHVVPVSRGGRDVWTNLVTACAPCNQRKGNRLLCDLKGWRLRTEPREPTPYELGVVVGLSSHDLEQPPELWGPYLEHYMERRRQILAGLRAAGVIAPSDDDEEAEQADSSALN